jgi:hypothetical protein
LVFSIKIDMGRTSFVGEILRDEPEDLLRAELAIDAREPQVVTLWSAGRHEMSG